MKSNDPRGPNFSDEEVREILRRAAERELQSTGTSLADLKEIAEEARLRSEFVAWAAAEVIAAREQPATRPTPSSSWRSFKMPRALSAVLGGVLLGVITGFLENPSGHNSLVEVPSFVLLVAAGTILCGSTMFSVRARASHLAGLLLGFGAGWSMINLRVTYDLLTGIAFAGATSAWIAAVRAELAAHARRPHNGGMKPERILT